MEKKESVAWYCLSLGMIIILVVVVVLFIDSFLESEKEIKASIIAGSLAVGGIIFSKHSEKKKETENSHREKKIEVYENLLNVLFRDVMVPSAKGEKVEIDKFGDKKIKINIDMINWASDEVIRLFNQLRKGALDDKDSLQNDYYLEDLIVAIRKDLGHSSKNNDHNILKFLIDPQYWDKYSFNGIENNKKGK